MTTSEMVAFFAGILVSGIIFLAYAHSSKDLAWDEWLDRWWAGDDNDEPTAEKDKKAWVFEERASMAIPQPKALTFPSDHGPFRQASQPPLTQIGFHIHMQDWGPDFTGEDDVLHRWRWTVWYEHHMPRHEITPEDAPLAGETVPLMLGNEPTMIEAEAASRGWILDAFGLTKIKVIVQPLVSPGAET